MEVVEKLVKLYSEINMIYIELHKLELVKDKDSDRFKSLIDLLKKDIVKEKKIYNDIFIHYEGKYEDLYNILDDCTDRPFGIRAEHYITNYDATDVKIYEGEYEEVIKKILENIEYSKLYNACSRNMYLIYLSFLQEYADSVSFNYLRERILNYKYYNSFINHDIENILIDSSFKIDRVNYINLNVITSMLEIECSEEIILDCCVDTIRTTISQILAINDVDYSDDNKKAVSINNQSMLRAALVIISDRDYNNIRTSLFNEYEGLCTGYNKIGAGIINSIFNERKKDKARVRRISLKPIED